MIDVRTRRSSAAARSASDSELPLASPKTAKAAGVTWVGDSGGDQLGNFANSLREFREKPLARWEGLEPPTF
jgi:hypothetical protein